MPREGLSATTTVCGSLKETHLKNFFAIIPVHVTTRGAGVELLVLAKIFPRCTPRPIDPVLCLTQMNNLEHVDSIDLLLLLICCLSASVRQVISHQLWPAQLVFCPELFTAQAEKLAHRTLVIIVLNPRSYLRNSDGETNLFDRDALLQCLVLYFDFDVTAPISTTYAKTAPS